MNINKAPFIERVKYIKMQLENGNFAGCLSVIDSLIKDMQIIENALKSKKDTVDYMREFLSQRGLHVSEDNWKFEEQNENYTSK